MTVHNFDESLAWSHRQSDQPWWEIVYRRAFPDMVSMVDLRGDGWHQRAGRDRAIVLSSGRTVYVDEKVRTVAHDDILVEIWSRYPLNGREPYPQNEHNGGPVRGAEPGWARKPLDCDWLAYAFVPTATCYLIPFFGLRAALAICLAPWIGYANNRSKGFRWVSAKNDRYQTISIAVPIPALKQAIDNALTITWSETAPAPAPQPAAEPKSDEDWPEVARPPDWVA